VPGNRSSARAPLAFGRAPRLGELSIAAMILKPVPFDDDMLRTIGQLVRVAALLAVVAYLLAILPT